MIRLLTKGNLGWIQYPFIKIKKPLYSQIFNFSSLIYSNKNIIRKKENTSKSIKTLLVQLAN